MLMLLRAHAIRDCLPIKDIPACIRGHWILDTLADFDPAWKNKMLDISTNLDIQT